MFPMSCSGKKACRGGIDIAAGFGDNCKMKLVPGDVILECNKVKISNADELYQALQKNSAYCHLLVKTMDGELKICESALYADAPHEIGIILFD